MNKKESVTLEFGDVIVFDNGQKYLVVSDENWCDGELYTTTVIDMVSYVVTDQFGSISDVLPYYQELNGYSIEFVGKFDTIFR